MRKCLWAFLGALIFSVSTSEAEVPTQTHDPSQCADNDAACDYAAYVEYRAGIIAEVDSYRQLEDRIGQAYIAHDKTEGVSLLSLIEARGLYRHIGWAYLISDQLDSAGVSQEEWSNLMLCRSAAHDARYLITAIAEGTAAASDRSDYLESVQQCEKAFKLRPMQSLSDAVVAVRVASARRHCDFPTLQGP